MALLAHETCLNHVGREAVARCPECQRFYCRECITEHDDRVICAHCLKKILRASASKKKISGTIFQWAFGFAGLITAWLFFYGIAGLLLKIPTTFHDGSVWHTGFWNE
ncbi:MAG: rhomboid family protein [Verrucomicrobiota bacterium]